MAATIATILSNGGNLASIGSFVIGSVPEAALCLRKRYRGTPFEDSAETAAVILKTLEDHEHLLKPEETMEITRIYIDLMEAIINAESERKVRGYFKRLFDFNKNRKTQTALDIEEQAEDGKRRTMRISGKARIRAVVLRLPLDQRDSHAVYRQGAGNPSTLQSKISLVFRHPDAREAVATTSTESAENPCDNARNIVSIGMQAISTNEESISTSSSTVTVISTTASISTVAHDSGTAD